jgi:hypothetical protein
MWQCVSVPSPMMQRAASAAARRAPRSLQRSTLPGRLLARRTGVCRTVSYLLGIETSCDDTAVAVVDTDGNVLSNVVSSQWELNAKWKGALATERLCLASPCDSIVGLIVWIQ